MLGSDCPHAKSLLSLDAKKLRSRGKSKQALLCGCESFASQTCKARFYSQGVSLAALQVFGSG